MKSIFNFKKNKISTGSAGFTLVELMVAVTLFLAVTFVALGAVLSVFSANKKVQSMKSVVDNFNFALEDMDRTIRFGDTYHCTSSGTLSSPQDCTGGGVAHTQIAVQFNSATVVYRLTGSSGAYYIEKSADGGSTWTRISPIEVTIRYMRFYVYNTSTADNLQPYVIVVIEGYVGSVATSQSTFSIETTLSQRNIDR